MAFVYRSDFAMLCSLVNALWEAEDLPLDFLPRDGLPGHHQALAILCFGVAACGWGVRRWYLAARGLPQLTLEGRPIPWQVWPLVIFSGLMLVAATLPSLLGQPMWLLERLFALLARLGAP